ncbi:hypothetical protein BCEN4_740049 [Burkholderia cenocepacia]|uniref:hypothetical protein n=2 Tax=Pseudomonadota TaxID=1224 RepID=UPI00192A9EB7|nr:hypothetical protein [Burkholderia cenocepacia]CAD9227910.1 hypothetical protein BCEN4_740049 [Burkholderia cenocepacia]
MSTDLEERINHNLRAIVPEEHREQYMTELAWGTLSPYQRQVESSIHYNGKKWVWDGLNPPPYDLKDGFVYNKITGQPFNQIKDSLYLTCLIDEKAPELIEHVKAKYGSPTPDQHYDILATHTSARYAHRQAAFSYEQNKKHLSFLDKTNVQGIPHEHLTQAQVNEKHEKLIIQAVKTFKITEESYLASKGDREELNLSDDIRGLLKRNKLDQELAEKPSFKDIMKSLGGQSALQQGLTQSGKRKM